MTNISEGRILELHSPDGVHECWLRAIDSNEANVWFNALHSALAALTLKALRLASALPDPPHLQHIGWLSRRNVTVVSSTKNYSDKIILGFMHFSTKKNAFKVQKKELQHTLLIFIQIRRDVKTISAFN